MGVLAAFAALLLRELLTPFFGRNNPYHTIWAAVVFSVWYCGVGPAVVTALVGVMGIWYWFLPLAHSFALEDSKTAISGMVGFLFFAGLIIALGESARRSLDKVKLAERQLTKAHEELERKVEERTADLNLANESLRELSSRLQQLRDEEHRRIARELHDSVGQLVAALSMNLGTVQLQAGKLDAAGARALEENAAMIAQISSEIRTISHLLHPPLLDAAGLSSALRWFVDGFSERSKIRVDLELPSDLGRLTDEMEIAIFRIVQECLTNIHRHSGGDSAVIRVQQQDHRIFIEVEDHGSGISEDKLLQLKSSGRTGVGFRGMRERVRQFGGNLDIQSNAHGTVVSATLPLQNASSLEHPS